MNRGFDKLQKISLSLMAVLVLLTFVASNLHAVLWQTSDWLVSTVLPSVVIDLTNDERADQNAQPLVRNTTLDKAAKLKAKHMAQNEYFSHYSPDGVSPWHWFSQAGYSYAHAGENLAIHFTDSDEVVDAWMNSPSHRQNIIDKKYTEIGVGTAKGTFDGYDTVYVVQLFGTPAAVPSNPVAVSAVSEQPTVLAVRSEPNIALEAESEANITANQEELPVLTTPEPQTMIAEEVVQTEEVTLTENEPAVAPVAEEEQQILVSEELAAPIEPADSVNDSVVLESTTLTDSSGLPAAEAERSVAAPETNSVASLATQPNSILQLLYGLLSVVIIVMLLSSIILETQKLHFAQASYGALLLFVMGGLWYFHALMTNGAVIA